MTDALAKPAKEPARKSLAVSAALSFFLGPIGLVYAAPVRVAVPAALAWVLACAVIPTFFLVYIALLVCPVSAVAGVLYAWGFNQHGRRTPLLGGKDGPAPRVLPR